LKVIQIAGFLGSGKTSALLLISKKISSEHKKRVAIIVNEIGDVPVDARVLELGGLRVKEIAGGCICCELSGNLALTLSELAEKFDPDIVLIEPTGVAIPDQVKVAIGMGRRDTTVRIDVGPVIVIYDALRIDELLSNETVNNFINRQILNAEVVAINKVDLVDETRIQYCENKIRETNPNVRIMRLSALKGEGINELTRIVLEEEGTADIRLGALP
jgi:G3E family GTPase